MDILEPNLEVKQDLLKVIKALQWGQNLVDIKGSASLASQKYFGDYDLYTIIKGKSSDKYDKVVSILHKIQKNPNVNFIELKIQYEDPDKKIKYNPENINQLKEDDFKEPIEYIKLDFVVRLDNIYFLLSINYIFKKKERTNELKDIKQNKEELIRDGDYFKALKRQFSIYKVMGRKDKLVELTNFFNSETGRKNQVLGNLEAIKQLLEHGGKTGTLFKKILVSLKDLGYTPPKSPSETYDFVIKEAQTLQEEINEEAKNLL